MGLMPAFNMDSVCCTSCHQLAHYLTQKGVNEYILMNGNPYLSPSPAYASLLSHTFTSKGVHIFLSMLYLGIIHYVFVPAP